MVNLMQEVTRLSNESVQLGQAASGGSSVQLQQQMIDSMNAMATKIDGNGKGRTPLMDVRGLGKPETFHNTHEGWQKWSRTMENFVIGVFGDEFRSVIEIAAESDNEIAVTDLETSFGEQADELDRIPELHSTRTGSGTSRSWP